MYQPISYIAKSRNVDPGGLLNFAMSNEEKYAIVFHGGAAKVVTWLINGLLEDFRKSQSRVSASMA